MKENLIKLVLLLILIFHVCIGLFVVTIPLVVVLLIFFFVDLKRIKKADLSSNDYPMKMFWFIVYSVLTFIWSPNLEDAIYEVLILIMLVLVGFLLFYFIKKYKCFSLILYSLLIVSFINHLGALELSFLKPFMYNSTERGGLDGVVDGFGWKGRFSGITPNPNILAVLLLFSLFLSLYSLDDKYKLIKLSKPLRFICFFNILLCLYTIFLTQSRKGMIFGILLILLYAILKFSAKRVLPYAIGVILLFMLPTFLPDANDRIEQGIGRVEAIFNISSSEGEVDNSALTRYYFITEGWKGFLNKPIFGHGINSFRHYYGYYAHNNFIELLFSVGLIGFLIYYSIYWNLLKKLIKNAKENAFLIAFLFIIVSMDVGHVSYENKMSMLTIITLFLIVDQASKYSKLGKE